MLYPEGLLWVSRWLSPSESLCPDGGNVSGLVQRIRRLFGSNDHDPRPLHDQLMMEREGQFEWSSHEEDPHK